MNEVVTATPAGPTSGAPPPPLAPLRRVRWFGYAALGIQLGCFLAWSTIQYSRFALTSDFAVYHQAWVLIAHGNLDPWNTVQRHPFWQDHSEFMVWPLAPLYWLWPHGVTLLWLQDACVVGAGAVAFTWLCEIAQRCRPGRDAAWLAGAGLLLLVANPWTWRAVAFDFHIEAVAVLFAALLARDLANGRRRAWVWVAPLLACGDVAGTYLAGLGLGGVLAGRRSRLPGTFMACLGVVATLVISLVHANKDSGLQAYAYLAAGPPDAQLGVAALARGIAAHPLGVLSAMWAKRLDLWGNLAPAGMLGVGFRWLLPVTVVVVLANSLPTGVAFAAPSFQYLPLYVLLPAGTVIVLGRLMRSSRLVALLAIGLVVAQALAWAAVWAPRTPAQWLRVSAPAAAMLAAIEARIPASAAVIASQGVVGRFSGRADVQALFGPSTMPVDRQTWFVITPLAGVEMQSTASAMALIGELAGPLHATLVTHADGVWAFRWRPPPGVHAVSVPDGSSPLPGWEVPGAAGRAVMAGPVAGWHATSSGRKGYVADGLAWQVPPGRYQAAVTFSASGPVNVEVWNDTGHTLLARLSPPAATGIESVVMLVNATARYRASAYVGWGPFRAQFVPPPQGERLEVRVWSPGGETVNVYSADLTRAGRGAPGRPDGG